MKKYILLVLVALTTTFCVNAQKKVKNLTVDEFEKGSQVAGSVILDVRTPEEYQTGHLKNSKLLDISEQSFSASLDKLDKNKTYYVYCQAGGRSTTAVEIMIEKGFKKVYNLSGGIAAWKKAQKVIEK
ncbi:MAG: rhodanese-like domain-containing protein [Raineya sp.]|jgi:rhodanese-related sulfurtransferase|nr:rhodanese-like domain-containing protein [Raineya sp.]